MKIKLSILFSLFFILSTQIHAQKPAESEEEYEKAYQRRIRQERLFNVYIPKDLTDAFVELNKRIDNKNKEVLRQLTEEEVERKLFFSLGRWVVHNWGFYGGSRLSEYMKTNFDVHHPEQMATFILIAYHRNLKREPLNIKQLVEQFAERKKAEEAKRKEKSQVIHQEVRKRQN